VSLTSKSLDRWATLAGERVRATKLAPITEQVGRVESVADGIALISGLPDVRLNELLRFEHGQAGFAITLERDAIGCVLLDETGIEAGNRVHGTGEVLRVPVGPGLLGRIVDPLGRPLDGGVAIDAEAMNRLSARRLRSSTAISSASRCRPGCSCSTRCLRWGAVSAS